MALAQGFRIRSKGYPKHEPADFDCWLYGRMFGFLRNKLGVALDRQEKGYLSPRGGDEGGRLAEVEAPVRPEVDEALVSDLCAKLGPLEHSIVRRLADGEFIDDIAEALGITPLQVKRTAARVARERNGG